MPKQLINRDLTQSDAGVLAAGRQLGGLLVHSNWLLTRVRLDEIMINWSHVVMCADIFWHVVGDRERNEQTAYRDPGAGASPGFG